MSKILKQIVKFSSNEFFGQYTKSNPIILIDVGARGGIDTKWYLLDEGNLRILGFEADPQECERLNRQTGDNHTYFPIALFNRAGAIEINIAQSPATSSIYLPNLSLMDRFPNSDDLKVVKLNRVRCNTLDRVLELYNIRDADFLKVDTQGSEFQILEGARCTLKNFIFGVEVEVEFSQLYKNQPLFSDVDIYLRDLGFSLFDINLSRLKRKKYGNVYSKGQVLWAHALYFKDFLLNKNINSNYLNFEKVIKAIAIAELYGFSDFALELLDFYYNREFIDNNIYQNVRELLVENRLSPEYQLLKNVRFAIRSYLKQRIPSLYNLVKKKLQ